MSETLIKVEGLSKKFCRSLKKSLWYGVQDLGREMVGRRHNRNNQLRPEEFWAVNDISYELKRGECLGLIGHNGAGKSTLLKILNGLIKPDGGRVTIHGRVGALIELGAGFNPILTGRENIYINGSILGFSKQEIDDKFDSIVEFAEMSEFLDTPVQNYSSGMKVRLGFAVAAQMETDVLFIDEVLAVGDIGFRVKCLNRIHELLANSAVIFVSHSMPAVARVCTAAMVMKKGKNIFSSADVSEAIDAYHNEFSQGERKVVGNGEVEIKEIRINGESQDSIPSIPFGSDLRLHIDLEVHASCREIGIRVQIWDQDQRPVADILDENYHSYTWENNYSSISIQIATSSLRLSAGQCAVSVIIFDPATTTVLCRMDNAVSFVMGQYISTGCASFIDAHWSMKSHLINQGGS